MRLQFPRALWKHRELWWHLTQREILGRYRGSALGLGWSFITPLAMLAVYTFVFSEVFKARWGGLEAAGPLGFATNLFAGLIVFSLFSECVSKAPNLITDNPNYVKKVIFPLEVLGAVVLGSATFHAFTSLLVLLIFVVIAFHSIPLTIILIPIVWIPLFFGSLSATWLLAAAGVFLRDIGQLVGVALNILMFLSPIFYPASALPASLKSLLVLNPLGSIIENTRLIAIHGEVPSIVNLFLTGLVSIGLCEISFRIFKTSKSAFADVI